MSKRSNTTTAHARRSHSSDLLSPAISRMRRTRRCNSLWYRSSSIMFPPFTLADSTVAPSHPASPADQLLTPHPLHRPHPLESEHREMPDAPNTPVLAASSAATPPAFAAPTTATHPASSGRAVVAQHQHHRSCL